MELPELYTNEYYKTHADRGYREVYSMFAVWLRDQFQPRRVLDIGCGAGFLLQGFHDLGIPSLGIEGSADAFQHIPLHCPAVKMDIYDFMRRPLQFGKFDLVCSVEVAEHLRPEFTFPFLHTLGVVAEKVFVTIAPDGDETVGHINLHSRNDWIDYAERSGLIYMEHRTEEFQAACYKSGKRLAKLRANNAMIFST